MIDALDIIAFAVIAVFFPVAAIVVVTLGQLPGQIAYKRGHPQAAAVYVAGWIGLATMGLLWPLALIWAFWKSPFAVFSEKSAAHSPHPTLDSEMPNEIAQLQARVKALEEASHKFQAGKEQVS